MVTVENSSVDSIRIKLLVDIGNLYKNNATDSALYFYQLALSMSINAGNVKYVSQCLNSIGNIYENIGLFEKALHYYFKALNLSEKINDKSGVANSLNLIGLFYKGQGFYDKALNYYYKSMKLYKELGDKFGVSTIYNNIGMIYFSNGKYNDAIENFSKSLKIANELNLKDIMVTCYTNIGLVYSQQGILLTDRKRSKLKYNQALDYFLKALEISEEIANNKATARVLINMADLYLKLREYSSSVEYSVKSLQKAKQANALFFQGLSYYNLAVACDSMRDYKGAYLNLKLFKQINDYIFNSEKSKQINDIGIKYETEKKEQEIIFLKKEKEIQMVKIKQNKILNVFFFAGILLIIAFFSLTYYNYKERQNGRLKSELLKQQEIYTKNIINAQEDERKRIARDLHDGIGQKISSLKMAFQKYLSMEEDLSDINKKKYRDMLLTIDETYKEVRTISHNMMPLSFQDGGLALAVHELIERTFYKTGISCNFGDFHCEGVSDVVSVALYRILQELFNNIIKHADAKNISVQLIKTISNLVMIVEDDGVGLENDFNIKEGIGLQNINARVKIFGGSFSIEPGYIKGTIATIRIPYINN